jgi:hypothetical protein
LGSIGCASVSSAVTIVWSVVASFTVITVAVVALVTVVLTCVSPGVFPSFVVLHCSESFWKNF